MIDPRDDDSLMLDDAAMLAESLKPQSPAPDRAPLKGRLIDPAAIRRRWPTDGGRRL